MTPPRFDVLLLFPIPLYVGLVDEVITQAARDATRAFAYEPNVGNANTTITTYSMNQPSPHCARLCRST